MQVRLEQARRLATGSGKDQDAGTVSVRHRTEGDKGAVAVDEFIQAAVKERDGRELGAS